MQNCSITVNFHILVVDLYFHKPRGERNKIQTNTAILDRIGKLFHLMHCFTQIILGRVTNSIAKKIANISREMNFSLNFSNLVFP